MKLLSILMLCLLTLSSKATNYWFSSSIGNDTRTTSTSASPWASLSKASSIALVAGDTVFFKSGDIFTGTLTTNSSGSAIKHIVYTSYGTGANAIINGFVTASSWTSLGSGIWESGVLATGGTVNEVTLDGVRVGMGRYPNIDASNGGYLTFESRTSGSTTNTITDNQLSTTAINSTWVNNIAEVVVRTTHSNIDRGVITAISGNVITFNNTFFQEGMDGNWGYFVTNSFKTLDQYGEWYYNPSTKKIDVYFGTKDPNLHTVKVSAIDQLLVPNGNYCTFRSLDFTGANTYGAVQTNAGINQLYFKKCNMSFFGIDAISLNGRKNFWMDSSTVSDCNSNGINLGFANDTCKVTNTTFTSIGNIASLLRYNTQRRYGFGIFSSAPTHVGLTATNNQIIDIGFIGIYYDGNNNLIYKNYLNGFCSIMDDGAGIYTDNYTTTSSLPVKTNSNNLIRRNIVINGIGAPLGTDGNSLSEGIYFDDNTNNVVCDSNTIASTSHYGIFIHNTFNSQVRFNLVYNTGAGQIGWQDDDLCCSSISNVLVSRNQLFANTSSQYILYMQSSANEYNNHQFNYGTIDSNIYCRPTNETGNIVYQNAFTISENFFTYTTWRATGKDAHTTQTPSMTSTTNNKYIYFRYNVGSSQLLSLGSATYKKLDGTTVTSSLALPDHTGIILIK